MLRERAAEGQPEQISEVRGQKLAVGIEMGKENAV
jgi:hypothetical protein